MAFKKAEKRRAKLRAQIVGPSGSGKTWTSLELATELQKKYGGKIAVIDSERGSASKYADRFVFDVDELDRFGPERYVQAIKEAEAQGYTILVIDSMSHEWAGTGGVLEKVDAAAANGNKWAGWRVGTPAHNSFMDAVLQTKCHVIATARAKTEWVLEEDERGKKKPRAVGLGSVQRDGVEYEFDVCVQLSADHIATVTKTRAPGLDGKTLRAPGPELAAALIEWLDGAEPAPEASDRVRLPDGGGAPDSRGVPGQAGSPPVAASPVPDLVADFTSQIAAAASLDTLEGIRATIVVAHKAKALTDTQKKALVGPYAERKKALAPPAEPATVAA